DLKNGTRYKDFLKNLNKFPTSVLDSVLGLKTISKDLDELENQLKYIPEKRFYPKNFLFYGDSHSGKTTIVEKLSLALVNNPTTIEEKKNKICQKAKDIEYLDEYKNHECIVTQELKFNTWDLKDLLKVTEADQVTIKQRAKKPIQVVSKFNLFTAQDSFDDLFSYRTRNFSRDAVYNMETKVALHRRFMESEGYMFRLSGKYKKNGRVKFTIKKLDPYSSGNIQDFIEGRFDIKFTEDTTLEEAKKFVYDEDIDNLYMKDDDVYLKKQVNINKILGGIITDVNYDESSFWVYNRYWNGDLPPNIIIPDNIESLHKNLREKLHWVEKKPINFIENNLELIVLDPQIESSTK
ncbi:10993_t:CDS:1, partial [Dentiscutata erythropus]